MQRRSCIFKEREIAAKKDERRVKERRCFIVSM
jgi:hypothetical protein